VVGWVEKGKHLTQRKRRCGAEDVEAVDETNGGGDCGGGGGEG